MGKNPDVELRGLKIFAVSGEIPFIGTIDEATINNKGEAKKIGVGDKETAKFFFYTKVP